MWKKGEIRMNQIFSDKKAVVFTKKDLISLKHTRDLLEIEISNLSYLIKKLEKD